MNKKSLKQIIIDKIFTTLYEENPDIIDLIHRVATILRVAMLGEFSRIGLGNDISSIISFLKNIGAYPGMDYLFVHYNNNIIILPVYEPTYKHICKSETIELFLLLIPNSFVWNKPSLRCLFPMGYLKRNYSIIKIVADEYMIMNTDKDKITQLLDKLQISWSLL
jgi:hypothetical protein